MKWIGNAVESFCREHRTGVANLLVASGAILVMLAASLIGNALFVVSRTFYGYRFIFWHVWLMAVAAVLVNCVGQILIGTGRAIWVATK